MSNCITTVQCEIMIVYLIPCFSKPTNTMDFSDTVLCSSNDRVRSVCWVVPAKEGQVVIAIEFLKANVT